ncbi:hypothetical protein BJ742DRAFT_817827 [Cladochytrium replicatum]|nr:hypothetical protein BJ742DRAFT_817827 [Cladochytrium replicatum]
MFSRPSFTSSSPQSDDSDFVSARSSSCSSSASFITAPDVSPQPMPLLLVRTKRFRTDPVASGQFLKSLVQTEVNYRTETRRNLVCCFGCPPRAVDTFMEAEIAPEMPNGRLCRGEIRHESLILYSQKPPLRIRLHTAVLRTYSLHDGTFELRHFTPSPTKHFRRRSEMIIETVFLLHCPLFKDTMRWYAVIYASMPPLWPNVLGSQMDYVDVNAGKLKVKIRCRADICLGELKDRVLKQLKKFKRLETGKGKCEIVENLDSGSTALCLTSEDNGSCWVVQRSCEAEGAAFVLSEKLRSGSRLELRQNAQNISNVVEPKFASSLRRATLNGSWIHKHEHAYAILDARLLCIGPHCSNLHFDTFRAFTRQEIDVDQFMRTVTEYIDVADIKKLFISHEEIATLGGDRGRRRIDRSLSLEHEFYLLMSSGAVLAFETSSEAEKAEWVARLRRHCGRFSHSDPALAYLDCTHDTLSENHSSTTESRGRDDHHLAHLRLFEAPFNHNNSSSIQHIGPLYLKNTPTTYSLHQAVLTRTTLYLFTLTPRASTYRLHKSLHITSHTHALSGTHNDLVPIADRFPRSEMLELNCAILYKSGFGNGSRDEPLRLVRPSDGTILDGLGGEIRGGSIAVRDSAEECSFRLWEPKERNLVEISCGDSGGERLYLDGEILGTFRARWRGEAQRWLELFCPIN